MCELAPSGAPQLGQDIRGSVALHYQVMVDPEKDGVRTLRLKGGKFRANHIVNTAAGV